MISNQVMFQLLLSAVTSNQKYIQQMNSCYIRYKETAVNQDFFVRHLAKPVKKSILIYQIQKVKNVLVQKRLPHLYLYLIIQKSAGCVKSMVTDMDNFFIQFPHHSTFKQRSLLIATAIALDFTFFEESPGGGN